MYTSISLCRIRDNCLDYPVKRNCLKKQGDADVKIGGFRCKAHPKPMCRPKRRKENHR